MSEIMNGDEINEIERYIPSGNPDALHRPLRNVVASHRALQAKVRELEERLGEVEAGRECVHIDEYQALQDRVHELEAKLRQVAQWVERESCGASLPSDPIEAIILIADERGKQVDRLNEKLRQVEQERDQLRARVERLESALRHIAEARWSPRTTASYDEDARYAYPERESYVRQYAQRALEGKEEYGTKSND